MPVYAEFEAKECNVLCCHLPYFPFYYKMDDEFRTSILNRICCCIMFPWDMTLFLGMVLFNVVILSICFAILCVFEPLVIWPIQLYLGCYQCMRFLDQRMSPQPPPVQELPVVVVVKEVAVAQNMSHEVAHDLPLATAV